MRHRRAAVQPERVELCTRAATSGVSSAAAAAGRPPLGGPRREVEDRLADWRDRRGAAGSGSDSAARAIGEARLGSNGSARLGLATTVLRLGLGNNRLRLDLGNNRLRLDLGNNRLRLGSATTARPTRHNRLPARPRNTGSGSTRNNRLRLDLGCARLGSLATIGSGSACSSGSGSNRGGVLVQATTRRCGSSATPRQPPARLGSTAAAARPGLGGGLVLVDRCSDPGRLCSWRGSAGRRPSRSAACAAAASAA